MLLNRHPARHRLQATVRPKSSSVTLPQVPSALTQKYPETVFLRAPPQCGRGEGKGRLEALEEGYETCSLVSRGPPLGRGPPLRERVLPVLLCRVAPYPPPSDAVE